MKYLEEIISGECFRINNDIMVLTSDFKSNNDRLCYSLTTGCAKWLPANTEISVEPIYTLDSDNNVIPIKKYTNQNSNIS